MTDQIVYVDTGVVGGAGNGTTLADAYSGLSAALTAEAREVIAGDRLIFDCRGGEDALVSKVILTTLGYSGDGILVLRGDSPDNPTQLDLTKYRVITAANYDPINVQSSPDIELDNFQISNPTASGLSAIFWSNSGLTAPKITIRNSVTKLDDTAPTYQSRAIYNIDGTAVTTARLTFNDSLAIGKYQHAMYAGANNGAEFDANRSTIEDVALEFTKLGTGGVVNQATDVAVKVAINNYGATALTNCATSHGVGTNPVTVTDWSAEFVNLAGDDFALAPASQLIGAGSTSNNIGVDQTVVATTLSADSITGGDLIEGTTRRINLSNAPSASGRAVSIGAGALTVVDEGADYVDVLIPNLRTFGDLTGQYNVNTTFTVVDGAESSTINGTILPLSGYEVGAITAVEGIYAEPEFSGVAVTDLYYTATISGADFAVGAVPVLGTEQTFNLWIQDQTDGVWGSPFVVTIPAASSGIPAASRIDVWKIGRYLQSTGTYNSAGINEVVMEWLIAEGIGRSQLNYMLYLYLEGLGYTGTLNDKLRKWSLDP